MSSKKLKYPLPVAYLVVPFCLFVLATLALCAFEFSFATVTTVGVIGILIGAAHYWNYSQSVPLNDDQAGVRVHYITERVP